jgi:PKD repeat protein
MRRKNQLFHARHGAVLLLSVLTTLAVACTPPRPGGPPTTVNPSPTAVVAAVPTSGTAPLTVEFDSSGSTDDGTIASVSWDYGDGSALGTADGSHIYWAAGVYPVTLTVTDDDGATDTDTTNIVVSDAANARYVATTGTNAGDCTSSNNPCLTVTYAVGQAVANDTVFIAPGAYPEDVVVQKDLTLKGANAGIPAGTQAGARGPESIVRTVRTAAGGVGSVWYNITIDGLRVDPQGDTGVTDALVPLVYLRGGATTGTTVVNTVLSGGPTFVPTCTPTGACGMAWTGIRVQGGNVTFADNLVEHFRYGTRFAQTAGGTPSSVPLVANIERNVITGVSVQGIGLGGATGQQQPGALVDGNAIDAVGRATGPGGIVITNNGNTITDNTFTDLGSGVYISLCKKWDTRNITVDDNTFNSAGIVIETSWDGGQCITGSGGDVEGTGSWVVGGGRMDGFNANGNSFSATGLVHNATVRWGTSVVPVSGGPIDVSCNFWADASGPTTTDNPTGTGSTLTYSASPHPAFTFSPWEIASGGACTGTP